ncbi:hypothetical protein TNCV_4275531 [Trichonephila clavipes]|nr:hypothetical protein TNCV_4275531 [Trichonephila clavipes]
MIGRASLTNLNKLADHSGRGNHRASRYQCIPILSISHIIPLLQLNWLGFRLAHSKHGTTPLRVKEDIEDVASELGKWELKVALLG